VYKKLKSPNEIIFFLQYLLTNQINLTISIPIQTIKELSGGGKSTNELHAMFQQNLLHNVYNYYNSMQQHQSMSLSHPSVNSSEPSPLPVNINNTMNPANLFVNTVKSEKTCFQKQQQPLAKSNNFSIERILSMPSQPTATQPGSSKSSRSTHQNLKHSNGNSNGRETRCFLPGNLAKHFGKTPLAITAPLPPSLAALYGGAQANNGNYPSLSRTQTKEAGLGSSNAGQTNSSAATSGSTTVYKSKNAKKYKCDLCGRGFSRSNTLITHRVSLHSLIISFFNFFVG
jgi:hypothetical protein